MMRNRRAILGACVLLCVVGARVLYRTKHKRQAPPKTAVAAAVSPLFRALRPVFPYSVVPGGVYSAAELRFQESRDQVVNRHYAGFDVGNARTISFDRDIFLYASYRKHDQIFWTARKLRIPKGEVLLFDGANLARTRCGNRLSEQPHTPAEADGGPVGDLAIPPSISDPRIVFTEEAAKTGTGDLPSPLDIVHLPIAGLFVPDPGSTTPVVQPELLTTIYYPLTPAGPLPGRGPVDGLTAKPGDGYEPGPDTPPVYSPGRVVPEPNLLPLIVILFGLGFARLPGIIRDGIPLRRSP